MGGLSSFRKNTNIFATELAVDVGVSGLKNGEASSNFGKKCSYKLYCFLQIKNGNYKCDVTGSLFSRASYSTNIRTPVVIAFKLRTDELNTKAYNYNSIFSKTVSF